MRVYPALVLRKQRTYRSVFFCCIIGVCIAPVWVPRRFYTRKLYILLRNDIIIRLGKHCSGRHIHLAVHRASRGIAALQLLEMVIVQNCIARIDIEKLVIVSVGFYLLPIKLQLIVVFVLPVAPLWQRNRHICCAEAVQCCK